ncbi:MAG: GerMN domain-containing protein [Treponema sp.]|nr:GerMN domain-containing protein [Treponema sp.]
MAPRKKDNRKKPAKSSPGRKIPLAVLFWIVFFIIIAGVFFIKQETIRENLRQNNIEIPFLTGPLKNGEAEPEEETPPPEPPEAPAVRMPQPPPEKKDEPAPPKPERTVPPAENIPAAKPAPARQAPVQQPQTAVRERTIYFTHVDNDGVILRFSVVRKIPVSDSPMLDTIKALLAGPNAEEKRRGIVSLVPEESRILNLTVQGSTAYISFNDEFLFNTYGVEGYAAQLRQIVWTATEFSNVKDVQILIEGRRIDYLGEGIWIGSPVGRDNGN